MPAHRKNRVCNVAGCVGKHVAGGLCQTHYMRKKRHGHVESTRRAPGTGTITVFGYIAVGSDKMQEHTVIAERALGKPLPAGAEIHHVDHVRSNNTPGNLVICPSRAYHFLLHTRERALDACGDAGNRKCPFCKTYSNPTTMTRSKHGRHFYHARCKTIYRKNYDQRLKG